MRVTVVGHPMIQEVARQRWKRLSERFGVEVTIVTPARWRTRWFGSPRVQIVEPQESPLYRIVPLPVTDEERWGKFVFRSATASLRTHRPDLMYVMGEEQSRLLQQMILYRKFHAPEAVLTFFTWNNIRVPLETRFQRFLWNRACKHTDAAFAGSAGAKGALAGAGYNRRIHVQTELGVDTFAFSRTPAAGQALRQELNLRPLVVGYVGRIVPEKGYADLIEAVGSLPESLRAKTSLLFVGDGAQREDAQNLAQARGLSLVTTGEIDVNKIQTYFSAMDVFVLPSRTTPLWKEQFGLALAQAMSCGLAAIGSNSGAIPEVIGEAGRIFPEGNTARLAENLQELLERPEQREELGRSARQRIERQYSIDALAEDSFRIFTQMIEQKQKERA